MSRADLARLSGVSPSTVGRIEKGELDPSWGTLTKILEASGFQIAGERVEPTGDATAAVAARFVLDHVLGDVAVDDVAAPAAAASTATAPASESVVPLAGPADLQVWWERWSRVRWFSDPPRLAGITRLADHAAYISRGSPRAMPQRTVGEGPRAMSQRAVGEGRHWRELALRIDEAGFTYAVSDTPAGLEVPGASLLGTPRIYVSDPSQVIDVLGLEESAPDRGVSLVAAEWPELDGIVDGSAVRFTSIGQAIMDGMLGTEQENQKASQLLFTLMLDRERLRRPRRP